MERRQLWTTLLCLCAAMGCEGNDSAGNAGGSGGDLDTGSIAAEDTGSADATSSGGRADISGSTADVDAASSSGSNDAGAAQGGANLKWYKTCGDPVCQGWKEKSTTALCENQKAGASCSQKAQKCDPKDSCNALLLCSDKDPKAGPGGCPISLRATKRDIRYIVPRDEQQLARELYSMRLATWRYKDGDGSSKLGIIIDDAPQSTAVDGRGDRVDLYSYTSMAIAALKAQRRQLQAQRAQIELLRAEVSRLRAAVKR